MKDVIFLNLAFGPQYIEQQIRCNASILNIYPDATIKSWVNCYPPQSRTHKESLYGFKVWAVYWAFVQGYNKVIWIDTACILQDRVDWWFEVAGGYKVVAAKDDNKLSKCIGDKALNYFGNPDVSDWHLVGGSLYVFDFAKYDCMKIFVEWKKAEEAGMFGSQYEQSTYQINRHRHDEACMAMALYMNGSEPTPYDICRYNNGPESIILKDHFK